MTIRYKADHKVTREVTVYSPGSWIGTYSELYCSDHWEPIPVKRWVPCKVSVNGDRFSLSDDAYGYILPRGFRASVQADGTVRFEMEE